MDEHGPETEDELKAELIVVLRRADQGGLSSSQIAAAMGEAMSYYLSDEFVLDDEMTEAEAEHIAKLVREIEPEATAAVMAEAERVCRDAIRGLMGKKKCSP